jgi:HK97 family phage major capsid protein
MNIKEIVAKLKAGEELSEEDEAVIEATDDNEEDALTKAIEKLVDKIEAKKSEEIVDTKKIDKKSEVEAMTHKEKQNLFYKAVFGNSEAKTAVEYMNTTVSGDGGYTVPDEMFGELLNFLAEDTVIRANAKVIQNCPAHLDITYMATLPTSYFRAEAAKKRVSKVTFGQMALTPYSLTCVVPLTNELRQDSAFDIEAEVTGAMRESISQKEDEVFVVGDGDGKPTGIETYYSAYPAARKVTAVDYAGLADRIIAASTRLQQRYRGAAKWYMSTDQLEAVRTLKDKSNRYLFQDDLTGEFVGRIQGKPVVVNDNFTNIWFGDLKGYFIGQRGGLNVAMSDEASITLEDTSVINLFQHNMFALRVEERIDGELANNKALIAVEGGESSES